ncbi:uncharacterized protein V6R79_015228 [Siganus canaliculatus]
MATRAARFGERRQAPPARSECSGSEVAVREAGGLLTKNGERCKKCLREREAWAESWTPTIHSELKYQREPELPRGTMRRRESGEEEKPAESAAG